MSAVSVISAYVVLIAVSEIIDVRTGILISAICNAAIIFVLLNHFIWKDKAAYRRALPALALAPLIRLMSLVVPVAGIPPIYWYGLIAIPLLAAVSMAMRLLGLSTAAVGLSLRSWWPQALIGLSGAPLGMAAFFLFHPEPLLTSPDLTDVILGMMMVLIFTGVTEELVFRGVLLTISNEVLGPAGILCSSALYAVMYIGTSSLSYLIFGGLVGFVFAWCVNRSGSVWGVIIAHSLLNIGMFIIWPMIWP